MRIRCVTPNTVVALLLAAAGLASGAACPTLVSDWLALGTGSCSLQEGGTISNFRLNITTTGTPTALASQPAQFQNTVQFKVFDENRLDIYLANPVPASSSVTVNWAYTMTGPPGTFANAAQQLGVVQGDTTGLTAPLLGQVCAGGSFSTIPPGTCSGTLVTLAPSVATLGPLPTVPFTFLMRPVSADVFATVTLPPHASYVDILQSINFFDPSSIPQVPTTPAPPTLLLTLVALGIIAAFSILRRRAVR